MGVTVVLPTDRSSSDHKGGREMEAQRASIKIPGIEKPTRGPQNGQDPRI